MKIIYFPAIGCLVGILLFAVLMNAGGSSGAGGFPLLTLLFMSELGFLVTTAGAVIAVKLQMKSGFDVKLGLLTVACAVLAVVLAFKGYVLWTSMNTV